MSAPEQALIGGATRLYCIVGHPIAQAKSPQTFNPRFAKAGLDAVLVPVDVLPDRFEETMRGLMAIANLDGIVVTVPYKARALALADKVERTAAAIGATNALRREADGTWTADMFDGVGLMCGLRAEGLEPGGRRVMLIGAGGAGSAIAVAFAEAGAASITIHDVDGSKAEALAARVAAAFPASAVTAGPIDVARADMLVNASPVGMGPDDGAPIDVELLRQDLFVVDIIMKPEVTPLLAAARARGCRTLGGKSMLGGQAGAVAGFFGVRDET